MGDVKEGLPEEVTPGLQKDEKGLARPTGEKHSRLREQHVGRFEAGMNLVQSRLHREAPGGSQVW